MIQFLLDQGLPRSTVQHLQSVGLPSVHVANLGLAAATDEAILKAGRDRGAIVVTLDSDFHALMARSEASAPSVIRIRIQGLRGDGVARVIQQVVQLVESDLLAGAAVTVTERRLALRRLPLIPANDVDQSNNEATAGYITLHDHETNWISGGVALAWPVLCQCCGESSVELGSS